ncbi:hypothetical protein HY948_02215 [Candidatus Gottesmanbacteria bacterium]|nr:hypothetical protein [Candidatus Gottesmanbacteria bacterium]
MPRPLDTKADDATQNMLDGIPQIPVEWWDEPGMHIVGRCEGPTRDVASHGATVIHGHTEVIFSATVQTQFVLIVEDGIPRIEAYKSESHGTWQDIPVMEISPAQLQEQLEQFGGDEEVSTGQQFSNVRKDGASRKHWPPNHHPTIRINH